MTDTTTTPCWVLTNRDGEDFDDADGVPHFPTQEKAAGWAVNLTDAWNPRQLSHTCVTVTCTCCQYAYDEDEDGLAHFADMAEAEKALADYWSFAGGQARCDACTAGPCDPERGDHG
ncbi:hypothetical protein GCM10022224_080210 [Nonomuraea antimicrobica]|uniref:Uncharacterized protein n=1 Tax=Nonomuraea antimicrobica TaxID=561173 RepID=A0ABP7D959_9ACTN